MSSPSIKNKLQEYYQKKKLKLPHYRNKKIGEQQWKTILTLCDGTVFDGPICSNKSEADKEAAFMAMEYLKTLNRKKYSAKDVSSSQKEKYSAKDVSSSQKEDVEDSKPKNVIRLSKKTVIYVDIENQHKAIDEILGAFKFENLRIFAATNSSGPKIQTKLDSDIVDLVNLPFSSRDVSDIYIIMLATTHFNQGLFDQYLILSADKFGNTFVDLLGSNKLIWGANCKCFNHVSNLLKYLLNGEE